MCVVVCICVNMRVCLFDIYLKMYFTKDMRGIMLKEILFFFFLIA